MKRISLFLVAVMSVLRVTALTVPVGHLDAAEDLGRQLEFVGGLYGFYDGGTRGGAGTAFLLDRADYGLEDSDDFDIVGFTLHQWELVDWESVHVNFAEYFFDLTTTYEITNFYHVAGTDFGFGITNQRVQGVQGASFSETDVQIGDQVVMTGRGYSSEMRDQLEWTGYNHAHVAEVTAFQWATIQDDQHLILELGPNGAYGEQLDSGGPVLDADDFYSILGWNESVFPYIGNGSHTVAGRVNDPIRQAAHDLFGYPLAPVPEPASIAILGMGIIGFALRKVRRK